MKKFVVFIISSIFLILFTSCGSDMGDMIDQYNEGFGVGYTKIENNNKDDEKVLNPGDIGFKAGKMLFDEYFVWDDATLNLSAPSNCNAFGWIMYDPENNYEIVPVITANGSSNLKDYIVYIPDSGLESGKTYKLTLTVRGFNGEIYSDTCGVVVYHHYIFDD